MNKKIEEVKRYTLYTQLLNGIVTIGALVIIGLIIVDPSRLTEPDWVIWLLVVIGGMHTFEEYTWPGGFIRWINSRYFRNADADVPLSAKNAFFTDATAGVVIMAMLAVIGTNYLWLTLGIAAIFFINGAWHLTATVTQGIYSPGSISSALFNLPLGAYIIYFYAAAGSVTWVELLIAYFIGLLVHILFFATLRQELNKQQRLAHKLAAE